MSDDRVRRTHRAGGRGTQCLLDEEPLRAAIVEGAEGRCLRSREYRPDERSIAVDEYPALVREDEQPRVGGARLAWIGESPHVLEQLVAREHDARLPAERFEQLELLRAEEHVAIADAHLVTCGIHAEVADAHDVTAAGHPGGSSQDRAHA